MRRSFFLPRPFPRHPFKAAYKILNSPICHEMMIYDEIIIIIYTITIIDNSMYITKQTNAYRRRCKRIVLGLSTPYIKWPHRFCNKSHYPKTRLIRDKINFFPFFFYLQSVRFRFNRDLFVGFVTRWCFVKDNLEC